MSHVCICGTRDVDHEPRCFIDDPAYATKTLQSGVWTTTTDHDHTLPLCCENCPCLSVEEAHPAAVGHPLESLADIIGNQPLSTSTIRIMHKHSVYTMERLLTYDLVTIRHFWYRIGPKRIREIIEARMIWKAQVACGAIVPKPLPEMDGVLW